MHIHSFLITPASRFSDRHVIVWFSLSLIFAAIYSGLALQSAFSAEFVVQDDARQHVFWMRRFFDPTLFPNDWIADYFQSVAPIGYSTLYRLAAWVGVDPLLFSKLLPFVLGFVTAGYCFGVALQLLPVPAAAFSASLLLSQALGLTDAIISGTPKAFIYPILLAFLFYLLRRSWIPCLIALVLLGLFYPQLVFVLVGILMLRIKMTPFDRRLGWMGLGAAFLVLLPYALQSDPFQPVISAAEARSLPEFLPGGRSQFFDDADPWSFWMKGRGGIRLESVLTPATNGLGLLLPVLLRFPKPFPLVQQITPKITILWQIFLASLGMFALAHLFLFKLHLPSRYTEHSLRILLTLSAGMVLVVLIDAAFRWARSHSGFIRSAAAIAVTVGLSGVLLLYPMLVAQFPLTGYGVGKEPALYEFFQAQPTDSLIASLDSEANNLPTFAQRSILTGEEYAIPYHLGYYRPLRQRTIDLIQAQYSPELERVQEFIQAYGVDFWLLRRSAFSPKALENPWIQQYQPAADEAIASLNRGDQPAIEALIERCSAFQAGKLDVLAADCLLNARQ